MVALAQRDGNVIAIVEHRDASPSQRDICEINTGIYVAPTLLFQELLPQLTKSNTQNEYYLTDCVQLSVNAGREVHGIPVTMTAIMGVNDRKQLADIYQLIQR